MLGETDDAVEPAKLGEALLQFLRLALFQIPLLLQHLNTYQSETLQPSGVKGVSLSVRLVG